MRIQQKTRKKQREITQENIKLLSRTGSQTFFVLWEEAKEMG